MKEVWKAIPSWDGLYEVSNFGRARSLAREVEGGRGWRRPIPAKILSSAVSGGRYVTVSLSRDGKSYTKKVHALVLEAFVGPAPDSMEGCHGDGDSLNNFLTNLRWDTSAHNKRDMIAHGTKFFPSGSKHGHSKLTESNVLDMRSRYDAGLSSQKDLAEEYGVSAATISYILSRKTWRHI